MSDRSSRSLGGLFLIIVGVLFLFETFNILNFGPLFSHWWPLIVIAVGLFKLKGPDKAGGAILFVIGIAFLSTTLDIINWGTLFRLWPLVLIIIGLSMLSKRRHMWWKRSCADESSLEYVRAKVILGGLDRVVTSKALQGGDIMAIFGGIEIDFRQAEVAGDTCLIHLTAVFGGIEVKVPRNWQAEVTGTPILGAVEDKTTFEDKDGKGIKVELRCSATFGGIEIEN